VKRSYYKHAAVWRLLTRNTTREIDTQAIGDHLTTADKPLNGDIGYRRSPSLGQLWPRKHDDLRSLTLSTLCNADMNSRRMARLNVLHRKVKGLN